MNYEEAINRVQKLLKLANSPNAHEAASAAAAAQALMDKFQIEKSITEKDADNASEPDEGIENFRNKAEGQLDGDGKSVATWRIHLAQHLATANACRIFLGGRYVDGKSSRTIEIIGRPSDVGTVRYLYGWLHNEVERLAKRDGKGMGKTWANNFRMGCVDTIAQKLRDQRNATIAEIRANAANAAASATGGMSGGNTALVRVEQGLARFQDRSRSVDAWVDANMKFRTGAQRTMRHDYSAREAGRQAASSISIGGARGALGSGSRQIA